jgi:DNA-binding Lrp family transcriptional regulator
VKSIKLTEAERHILYIVLMNARATAPEIAAKVGCRVHIVQTAIRKFWRHQLISPRPFINIFRLGYSRHALYITLSSEGQSRREAIADFLVNAPCTTAVLDLGGEYDFFVSLVARSVAEVAQFNQSLSASFGYPFSKKEVALTVRHAVFGEKVLAKDPSHYTEAFYEVGGESFAVDVIDQKLLAALDAGGKSSPRELSRTLGLPYSTIGYRLGRLESTGVILGSLHEVRGSLIGLTNYILLVGMKALSEERHRQFYTFAKLHPNIPHLSYEFGNWDYMLGVAVERPEQLNDVVEQIRREFAEFVGVIKSFTMFRARKVRDFPFDYTNIINRLKTPAKAK